MTEDGTAPTVPTAPTASPAQTAAGDLLAPEWIRGLELHEARAHAHGGREVRDLGDAILLHDPLDRDAFVNRVSAMRLPEDPDACAARLTELFALFATLERRPHVWLSPAFHSPADLGARLAGDGFVNLGGLYVMVTVGPVVSVAPPTGDVTLERMASVGSRRDALVDGAAQVMVDAFGAESAMREEVADDLAGTDEPAWDVVLASVGGEPVSAGRRYTADGMTYLSSVGTRRAWWGRGFGAFVTSALASDGADAGGPIVHLGVEAENARAQRLYRRLGFAILGSRVADLILG